MGLFIYLRLGVFLVLFCVGLLSGAVALGGIFKGESGMSASDIVSCLIVAIICGYLMWLVCPEGI